ncbi:putative cardiolipin synthase YwiE [bacterium BMS3Abin07]|nr:putative cardiolipin synthase YwiE [bacterium BMS3Abin07]GBE32003.1 putative cardiolipin synthase YwiE [bacterium BMS3Bbin05]HDO21419.1 hypothetical protein [Nitrospirota bacterium]
MPINIPDIESMYGEKFVGQNRVNVFYEGNDAFNIIFHDMEKAENSIFLIFYIFKNDDTGEELARLLKKKAGSGLKVCILYDHFGSFTTSRSFWKDMETAGIEVKASRPLKWKSIGDYIHRDHRKLIVIDGKIVFTGGLNIADEYRGYGFFRHKKRGWRDTAIRVEGPVARRLHEIFKITWRFWKGNPITDIQTEKPLLYSDGLNVLPIFSSSARGRKKLRKLLYWCIRNTGQSIHLTTAYFTPSRRMMFLLKEAVDRGVGVELLLPRYSDMKSVMYAGRASFTKLLKWGIKIYLYNESILHAKSYLFDNVFSIIGSANLDFQSLRKNDEGNMGVFDERFAMQMEKIFKRDLEKSKKVELYEWVKRPFLVKLMEKFFVMFKRRL